MDSEQTRLRLYLFGTPQIELDGVPLRALKSSKARGILFYLAVTGKAVPRSSLAALMWGETSESAARSNLRKALQELRKYLGEFLSIDRDRVSLSEGANIWVDVQQFKAACQASSQATSQNLANAIDLYRADFLEGFYVRSAPEFESWWLTQRARLRESMLDALRALADQHANAGELNSAIQLTRRYLELEPWREGAHRRLMDLLARNGHRSAALAQYETCRQILSKELSVEPARETVELYEQITSEGVPVRERRPSSRQSPFSASPPHNLLIPTTPLVGRESELDDLDCYVADRQVRLITIVAAGGMGKTSLALACAERQLKMVDPSFPDGIFFIPFAQLEDPERVVDTLAEAIRFQVDNNQIGTQPPKAQLLDHLREKRMFLLIDNFEQLQAKATLLTELLGVSPGIQILVTSRERLHLNAEQVYPIGGLSVEKQTSSGEMVLPPAAQLFLQSASRNKPGFLPGDEADMSNLMQICRLVDGMPLALELAAGWVDLLSLAEIAAEIRRDLDFLAAEYHDMPSRHRGIRAVFDSTWRQLSQDEQVALARFSVFRNGCTKDAAQVVTGVSLKTWTHLSDKSLLNYEKSVGRYQIHPLLLQFSAEKLLEIHETKEQTREAHSLYYCMALEKWDKALKSPQHATALSEMRADYENIQLAWDWALTHGNLSNLLMAVDGLSEYYEVNRLLFQSQRMFGETIQRLRQDYGDVPRSPEALCLLALAMARQEIAGQRYHYENTEKALLESLELLTDPVLKGADTRREQAYVHLRFGMALIYSAHGVRVDEARSHLEKSLQLYRELGSPVGIGEAINILIDCAIYRGNDSDQIEPMISESLAIHRQMGDPRRLAKTLMSASSIARFHLLAYDKAFDHLQEAYAVSKLGEDLVGMADAQEQIGFLSWFLGEFDTALKAFEEALDLAKRAGSRYEAAIEHINIGQTQAYRGQFSQAQVLIREGLNIDQRVDQDIQIFLLFVLMHLGHYEKVRDFAREIVESGVYARRTWALRLLSWEALARNSNEEASEYGQHSVDAIESVLIPTLEWKAWSLAPLALAFHRQGQTEKAKYMLFEALQTSMKIRAFLPLMHLMPVIAVVMADSQNERQKEKAVALYRVAKILPFVANSKLFQDIAEKPIQAAAADLSDPVLLETDRAVQKPDWWQKAAALLGELRESGWAGSAEDLNRLAV